MRSAWDTVVIGSGSGGLTAAVALARAGQKVLVLEQHYLPGGWTQSFSLGGYRFSPGVHYIGGLQPGGMMRRMFEGLGVGRDLEFCELNPDGFDHLWIEGERFDIPKGRDRYRARLCERFPHERKGLMRYFAILGKLQESISACEQMLSFPEVLTLPFRAPILLRWGFRTADALLDATIRDPRLRDILVAQSGNHGLPPSRVSLPVHACVVGHYDDGAYYPRGGGKRIPLALIRALRRCGGRIRLRARVGRIVVERGRAVGVELEGGERIYAGSVLSNADPAITFGKLLLPPWGDRGRRKLDRMQYSAGLLSLFCAVEMDLRGRGYDSGNYWYYRTHGVGDIYERIECTLPQGPIDALFLTITTLKDPGRYRPNRHTVEMFSFVPYGPFARWSGLPKSDRGRAYERLKESLGDRMLAAAENLIPGISEAVVFRAVGTPLTNDFYCATHRGAAYGTAKTPLQLGPFSFPVRTAVRGLYCCGASTMGHGVAATALSGLSAAKEILGRSRIEDLLSPPDDSLRIYPADHPEQWLNAETAPISALEPEPDDLDHCAQ
jgi:phytoene dehydrogenase-like protein